jgi:ABC-type sugar transport system ATPase subunit
MPLRLAHQDHLSGGRRLTVLKDITFRVEPGAFLAIVGPSGSGKTTLLGLLAGLDRPSAGTVHLDGQELGALDEDGLARLRGEKIGFVFQSFQLIPTLTARENVQVPLELRGEEAAARATELLDRVGLGGRGTTIPPSSPAGPLPSPAPSRPRSLRRRVDRQSRRAHRRHHHRSHDRSSTGTRHHRPGDARPRPRRPAPAAPSAWPTERSSPTPPREGASAAPRSQMAAREIRAPRRAGS